ncbi:phosphoglucomutase PgcA [Gottschalkia purinilytica]|uniref:Phosphoglucomutase n=1 Tax=Gottschalkia purinilytica TaxID=1503 RepID=A0A0L0WE24_GOTPU|nr:phospho-sugar mutase [Gottschalkia purinilytica]KNF09686.1 phosphoglucomutase PgcA [Gottschalkia purinilytica]
MSFWEKYNYWVENGYFDDETKKELLGIRHNEEEIEDRFYKDLEFGTGGLRGKIGAGTNRMNKYTVAKTTQGLANYIIKNSDSQQRRVVIAYDSRYKSDEFAKIAALVLCTNNIKVYLFEDIRSTPELSFAIRYFKANAGIVITASHNPAEYNGYKAYGSDGGQFLSYEADKIIEEARKIEDITKISIIEESKAKELNLLEIIGKEVDDKYIEEVKKYSLREDIDKGIKIVYTPLHGTGNIPVRRVLSERGFKNIYVVKEQENPDYKFSTVKYPNPEEKEAFKLAIELGKSIDSDILIGTDPDCDRVGVVVKDTKGEYISLKGNEIGALLLDYILRERKERGMLSNNSVLIKTIVTSELGRTIGQSYGVKTIDTLTGFKYIGDKIGEFEETGKFTFEFGYEESHGYLPGGYVRDKDGVVTSMLICEMAGYYKSNGMTLHEAVENLYNRFGYFVDDLYSIKLEGIEGRKKIEDIMNLFRVDYPKDIKNLRLLQVSDYKESKTYLSNGDVKEIDLPKENVMKFVFEDNSWYALRPSGTEPKLKIYITGTGKTREDAIKKARLIKDIIQAKIKHII